MGEGTQPRARGLGHFPAAGTSHPQGASPPLQGVFPAPAAQAHILGCSLLPAGLPHFPSPAPPARWDSPPSSCSSRTLIRGSRRTLLGAPRAACIAAVRGRQLVGARRACELRSAAGPGAERTGGGRPCSSRSRSASPSRPEPSGAGAARRWYLRVLARRRRRRRRHQAPPRDAPSPPAAERRPAPSTPPPSRGGEELKLGRGLERGRAEGGRTCGEWGGPERGSGA